MLFGDLLSCYLAALDGTDPTPAPPLEELKRKLLAAPRPGLARPCAPSSRMSMILSWVLFPLVLAAVGLGWGALVDWAGGERELGALTIPLGLAAAIVVAALLTAFDFSAPAAAPVVAIGALAGLARAWRRAACRCRRWSRRSACCSSTGRR